MPLALFFGTFAWSFAYVSLPFYIQRPSGGDTATTLALLGLPCVPCAGGLGRRALA